MSEEKIKADNNGTISEEENSFVLMMLQMQIRRKLIHLRIDNECHIADLAEKTGISAADLIKIETGEMSVSVEDAGKIMDALEYFSFENRVLSSCDGK